jgi:TolB-like protein
MPEHSSRTRQFISELRRRRVFRVGSLYVVAAWAVIEGATTILPVLSAPEWVVALVVVVALSGFPVAVVLAWMYDLTGEGLERTSGREGGVSRVHRAPWLRPAIAVSLVATVLVGGWVVTGRLRVPVAESERASVAVFPFSVHGSPSLAYLREGMASLLSTNLNGAGHIHSVDPAALLREVGASTDPVRPQTARRIAEQFRASLMVLGEITETDGNIRVSARLYDLRGDGPPTAVAVPGRRADQLAELVDQLSELILSQYLEGQGMRMASTAVLTTESFPALKAYLTGESDYRSSQWARAIQAFQQAVALDSTFALAHYRLASAAEWAARFDLVTPAADAAYRHRSRLGPHDRELVEAFHAWSHGDATTAERLYRGVTARQPEDAEAWYRLGEVEYHYNPVRGRSFSHSRDAFERALLATPGQQPILFHLMEVALYRRDYTAFDSILAQAGLEGEAMLRRTAVRGIASGDSVAADGVISDLAGAADGTVFAVATGLAHYSRDLDGAARVAPIMTQPHRPAAVRATGHLLLAQLAAGRGRWAEARQHLDRLEAIHAPSALLHRALYAAVPFFQVPAGEIAAIRASVEAWEAGPLDDLDAPGAFLGIHNAAYPVLRQYILGILDTRLGEHDSATARIDALEQVDGELARLAAGLAIGLRSAASLESGSSQGFEMPTVTASLGQIANSAFYAHALERYNRARSLLAADSASQAAEWFVASMEGRNELFLAGPAAYGAARAYDAAENTSLARHYYATFLTLWQASDPVLRWRVAEAERALTRLRGRRD